jgi:hypothetical protein
MGFSHKQFQGMVSAAILEKVNASGNKAKFKYLGTNELIP